MVAPANPLRGLASDAAYLRSYLATVPGPIVLVGHSYGGAVITDAATGSPHVKALVYIAAYAPDAGETLAGLSTQVPGGQVGPRTLDITPYPLAALTEPSAQPAWKAIPSWFLVAGSDLAIGTALEKFEAKRMHATTTVAKGASHAVLVSRPGLTTKVILAAAKG